MIERGEGVIVNFSSGWGRSVSAGVAPYCATKYAIEGLTMALAEDLPGRDGCRAAESGCDRYRHVGRPVSASRPQRIRNRKTGAARAVPFILQLTESD